MHHYDCPCDQCRRGPFPDALLERILIVIERLEAELAGPPLREYDEALAWLSRVCGDLAAVAALDVAPLTDHPPLPPGRRLEAVRALLDAVAGEFFDPEMCVAFRRALVAVAQADPGLVLGPATPAYVAAGIAWAVGEANGVVGPQRRLTSATLKRYLATVSSPVVHARPIRRALGEDWPWRPEGPREREPALLALGRTDLLLGRTRARLIRVRDHALGDKEVAENAA